MVFIWKDKIKRALKDHVENNNGCDYDGLKQKLNVDDFNKLIDKVKLVGLDITYTGIYPDARPGSVGTKCAVKECQQEGQSSFANLVYNLRFHNGNNLSLKQREILTELCDLAGISLNPKQKAVDTASSALGATLSAPSMRAL